MGVVMALDMLLEQVRSVMSAVHRSETQRLLMNLEQRGLVERLPDVVTNRTAAWDLTADGLEVVTLVLRRLESFDRLLEREFHAHIEQVMDAVTRVRTVLSSSQLTAIGDMYEARLRVAAKLVPPKRWKAASWDL